MSRTMQQVSRTDVNRSTPGGIENSIGTVETSSLALIVIIGTAPTCGLNLSQEVDEIRPYNYSGLIRKSQNWMLSLTESSLIISIRHPFSAS